MTVKLGDRAIYYPRVPYGRQSELFCFVTRIIDAEKGIVDIVTFPAAGEFQHINNVMPKGEGIQIHCWAPREEQGAASDNSELRGRVEMLEARIIDLEARTRLPSELEVSQKPPEQLADEAFLEGSQWTPEQAEAIKKRGPGRPRKDAA